MPPWFDGNQNGDQEGGAGQVSSELLPPFRATRKSHTGSGYDGQLSITLRGAGVGTDNTIIMSTPLGGSQAAHERQRRKRTTTKTTTTDVGATSDYS